MLRKLKSIFKWVGITLLLIPLLIYFALQQPVVQTWISQWAAHYLSSELGAPVRIGRVDVDLWAHLVISDLFVGDQKNDTIAFISEVRMRDYHFDRKSGDFRIADAVLKEPYFRMVRSAADSTWNYQFIVNYLRGDRDTTDTTQGVIDLSNFRIENGRYKMVLEGRDPRPGFDWNNISLTDIQLDIENLTYAGDSLFARIDQLAARDHGGFEVTSFTSDLAIHPGIVRFGQSVITTPESRIVGDLQFEFSDIDDLDYFDQRVSMLHRLEPSTLQLADLAWFSSDLIGLRKTVEISGRFKGKISNLRGKDVHIQFDENSHFKGDFHFDGLPDIEQTFITLDIEELVSSKGELEHIQLPPFDSLHYLRLPDNFREFGQMKFNGNFTGFINDFVAFGTLNTAIGTISSDIALQMDNSIGDYRYKGFVATEALDLGRLYNDPSLGILTSKLNVMDGKGTSLDNMDTRLSAEIRAIHANGYTFTNITADSCTFRQRYFNGKFKVDDPHVIMDFVGQIDLSKPDPVLTFESEVHHADLKAINILPQFAYSSVSGDIRVNSRGLDVDKFQGEVELREVTYCSQDREYFLNYFKLTADRADGVVFKLDSDIAHGELRGDFNVSELPPSFLDITSKIVPQFDPPIREHRSQRFTLDLTVSDFSDVSGIFIPDLSFATGTRLQMDVNEEESYFEISLISDSISYQDYKLEGMLLDARRPDESLYLTVSSDQFRVADQMDFKYFTIDARTEVDTIYTDLAWGDTTTMHRGDIKGKFTIRGFENLDFDFFRDSYLHVGENRWDLSAGSRISMDSTDVRVNGLSLSSRHQRIKIDGTVSKRPQEVLNVDITAFDLSNLNILTGGEPQFGGMLTGTAQARDLYDRKVFSNDVVLMDFKLNDDLIGDLCITNTWDNIQRRLRIDGELEKEQFVPLSFSGYYSPDDEKSPLDIVARFGDLDLAFLNAFIGEDVLGIRGFATGTLAVTGKPDAPLMEGDAYLRDAWVYVPYLNTSYQLKEQIGIYPDMFTFDHIQFLDQEGTPGFVTGQILHTNFERWNYDLLFEVPKPMLAMNTDEERNPLYYGKAFASGEVNIYGYDEYIEFDIHMASEKGTRLAMPMNSAEEQSFGNFVRFIDKTSVPKPVENDLSGIRLNLELDITEDAEFQIIFDEAVGDVMSGRGKGHLTMEINNLSSFNMYGTVEVVEGNYLFTLKNLVNKDFTVYPGGTIAWFGDPFKAELNLDAVYKVSASLYDLIPDSPQSGQRVPVDLVLHLDGKMLNPGVAFDVALPGVDEVTRARVQSAISTEQERNRQAFSLLVLRRFVTPPNITLDHNSSNALAENGTELLTNQLSNWLNKISDDFNLGFNYRPGDEISNEEIAVLLSTQLFDDRLILSGNFGVSRGNQTNQNPTNYIGDIRVEYKITPEGKIRLLVYNESNDFRMATTQQSPYTQGVGLLYQEEFDTWDQFVCGFKQLFVSQDKRKDC